MSRYFKTVEVEIDVDDVLDQIDDKNLAELDLFRRRTYEERWRKVKAALQRGDNREVLDLISEIAWEQASVTLPVPESVD